MPSGKKTTKSAPKAEKTPKTEKAAKAPVKAAKAPKAANGNGGGSALVIVESPAKQKTISRILDARYVVRSSYGHVRDLPNNKLGVDEKQDFEPTYVLLPRTKKILPELKDIATEAREVFLATDHDREGESIAWHLVHILGLDAEKIRRITFHEITQSAIQEALRAPRGIDLNLVHAQQARRVLDRLVGYKLSPLLWKKVRRGLSAGRVQSVAVRLLVERESEIKQFKSEPYWTLEAKLQLPGTPPPFHARLVQWKGEKVEVLQTLQLFSEPYRVRSSVFKTNDAIEAVSSGLKAAKFKVRSVEKKEVRRNPSPPFTTSTLQQAASQKFGFPAEKTMRIAQTLYEGVSIDQGDAVGLITYMRTDSVNVAAQAQQAARQVISAQFGAKFLPAEPPVYKTKSKGAQEAHEAIRPTGVERDPKALKAKLDPDQAKLYELIWKRFVASQMAPAVYDTVTAEIEAGEGLFRANGRALQFEGFLKVYGEIAEQENDERDDDEEREDLPPLTQNALLDLMDMEQEEHATTPPPHYNEASLIRALEKHGIGRPSTYAPTIKTIVERGYVKKGLKDRTLQPSELGVLVTDKLKEHFPDVVNLTYTADVEERLDKIAEGSEQWQKVVRSFFMPFQDELVKASTAMEDNKPKMTDEKCPLCGSPMLLRESRFGKYLSCSTFPKCKGKAQLTAEGEKVVPQVTDEKCDQCGKPMVIRTGRKGKFLACSGYPACKNTFSLDAEGKKIEGSRPVVTERKCEKCGSAFWLRLGKRGHFLACSGFPRCRNLKPVAKEEAQRLTADAEKKRAASSSSSNPS